MNKRNKRIISILLSLVIYLGMLPVTACTKETQKTGALSGRSYETVINQSINAMFELDVRASFELVPEGMIRYYLEQAGLEYDELDRAIDDLQREVDLDFQYYQESTELLSFVILEVQDVTGLDLDYIKDFYESIDVRVSAAKIIEAQITTKVSYATGETETQTDTEEIPVIKVGDSWYLDFGDEGIHWFYKTEALSGRSYEAVIKQYINASFECDLRAILELVPEGMIWYFLKLCGLEYDVVEFDELDKTIDELQRTFFLSFQEYYLYCYETYELLDCEILKIQDVTGRDLDYIKDFYESFNIRVSAAKIIEAPFTVKLSFASGETETYTENIMMPVIKVGDSWYLGFGDWDIDLF